MKKTLFAVIGLLLATAANAQVPTPDVVLETDTCKVTISAEPPDSTGGWTADFRRDDGAPVGQKDSTPPYERASSVAAGPHTFTVKWTKKGEDPLTSAAIPRPCPKPDVPPPPPPKDCVTTEWSPWTTVPGSETPWVCASGTETRSFVETRTRAIETPAEPGGAVCGALEETRSQTETRPCALPMPGANAYFEKLSAMPNAIAYSLRTQAQVDQYSMGHAPNTQITATPNEAVMQFKSPVSGLSIENMLELPANAKGFTSLLVTWDAWFGPDFVPYSGHQKHFRISSPWTWGDASNPWDQQGRWAEIISDYQTATAGMVGKLEFRSYGRLGPNASDRARLVDGTHHNLTPWQIAKDSWTRYWFYIETVPGTWEEGGFDRVSLWAADQSREPVLILDRLQMEAGLQGISDFRLQVSTGEVYPPGTVLDHKVKNIVILRDVADVTALLEKPVEKPVR